MSVPSGSRLGPYEILAPIGAGGMGEVYRARDTRLGRDVAIKVLPPHRAASPESRQRFEREARTISQLAHPHICSLFDVGRAGETDYLVMELLEGETLAARLERGALPLEQTLRCGVEIADALDKAHRRGIVHRDLKPANVMLTRAGVKLLDLGLAKGTAQESARASLTALPTQQGLTAEGAILGTFEYMAPEQLEGREADARTDIFALGAVLHEMATGQKAFSGRTQASLISSIMKEDPAPISTIDPASPAALDRLARTCLAKDPDDRWQSAADIRRELSWIAEERRSGASGSGASAVSGGSAVAAGYTAARASAANARPWLPWSIAGAAAFAAAAFAVAYFLAASRPARKNEARRMELSIVLPERTIQNEFFALSPDGGTLAFSGIASGKSLLRLRGLDSGEVRALPGTNSSESVFWSPDGKSLGFVARGKLRRIDVATGSIDALADAEAGRGGTWSSRGDILFAQKAAGALYRVPASGGAVTQVTTLEKDDLMHRWPQFLPDGKRFLFYVRTGSRDTTGTYLASLGESGRKLVLRNGATGVFLPPATLLYCRSSALLAQPFDPDTGELSGSPVTVARPVMRAEIGSFIDLFSVSQSGVLVYRAGSAERQLTWMDRKGQVLGKVVQPDVIWSVALSPDDREAAISTRTTETGVYASFLVDLARNVTTPLVESAGMPVWMPDGRNVLYRSEGQKYEIRKRSAHGDPRDATAGVVDSFATPQSASPDGHYLLYTRMGGNFDIGVQSLDGSGTPEMLLASEFDERTPRFSPDGRWFVYSSDEPGQAEIFVRRFPMTEETWRVSTAGGVQPSWSRNGNEIYFVSLDGQLMAAPVKTAGSNLSIGSPEALFRMALKMNSVTTQYAAAADGRRFLVAQATEDFDAEPFRVLLNWQARPMVRDQS